MLKLISNRNLIALGVVFAVMLLSIGGLLPPDALAAGAFPLMAVGSMDLGQLSEILEKRNKAWEEFKAANDARLKAIESKGYAPEDLVGRVDVINKDLDKLGKQLADVQLAAARPGGSAKGDGLTSEQAEHKAAFETYLRKGDTDGLREIERKAMNSTSDPDGGYLVDAALEAAIDRVADTIGALGRIARNVTIGTRSWKKRVKSSGMAITWPGEGATSGESATPKYEMVEIVVHPGEVEPWTENEALEDADQDLAADLAMEAGIAFAEGEGSMFITGNGVAKPMGLTSYQTVANASYSWGKIGYIASGKSAAFASVAPADKIIDLQHALKPKYRPGAVWLMNDSTLGTVRQIKDGSGAYYLWQPDPASGFGGRLLGSPVEVDDFMPAIGANSLSLAFGNFQRGYAVVRRNGIMLIRDNITSKGITKFNFRRRVGGGVYNFEAIKLMKFHTS